jgi:hypothetical protein
MTRDAVIEAMNKAFIAVCEKPTMQKCSSCSGSGYDDDWCEKCGGVEFPQPMNNWEPRRGNLFAGNGNDLG